MGQLEVPKETNIPPPSTPNRNLSGIRTDSLGIRGGGGKIGGGSKSGGKITREVMANGDIKFTQLPSKPVTHQPSGNTNPPIVTPGIDSTGGHTQITHLQDEADKWNAELENKWRSDNRNILRDVRHYGFDKHPQTVEKAPKLTISDRTSRREYLTWARAEYTWLTNWEKEQDEKDIKQDLDRKTKNSLIGKITRQCPEQSRALLGSKTESQLKMILTECRNKKAEKDFKAEEIKRKARIKASVEAKEKAKRDKATEKSAKTQATAEANKAGIKRKTGTSKEIEADIAIKKLYPALSTRIWKFFNKQHSATKSTFDEYMGGLELRKSRLINMASKEGTTVADELAKWNNDYVAKWVNNYLSQYTVKLKDGNFQYGNPPPASKDTIYTDRLYKLILKARRFTTQNLPIAFLGQKKKDNKFLKPPKARITSKLETKQKAEETAKKLAKSKQEAKERENKRIADATKANEATTKMEEKASKDKEKADDIKNPRKKLLEKWGTETQKASPERNFITDPLKSGENTRYTRDSSNSDYVIDSILQHVAYRPNRPNTVLGRWKYHGSFSNTKTAVYINDAEQRVKMAFKGTDNISEIPVDFFSILLSHSLTSLAGVDIHFQNAIKSYNKVASAYPSYDFSFTGHSLGARTAIVVSDYEQALYAPAPKRLGDPKKSSNFEKLGGKVKTGRKRLSRVSAYATGSGLETFIKSVANAIGNIVVPKWKKPTIYMYRTSNDPLSKADMGSSHNAKMKTLPVSVMGSCSSLPSHTSLNFLHEDFWTLEEAKKCKPGI